jgi:hypothetical protein
MTPTLISAANAQLHDGMLALADIAEQKLWERQFEAIPGVSRIKEGDFARLHQLLGDREDPDSYLTSPVYYSFTGRNGLWVYEKDETFVLACRHPNIPNQILIFPQLEKHRSDLVADLLGAMPVPSNGVQIARSKSANTSALPDIHFDTRHVAFQKKEETVLDWKYPVRILSTDEVAALSGHKYMKIRNHIRALKKHSVNVVPFDAIHHSRALERLLHRWAKYNATSPAEYEHLYAPYETLFSQSIDKPPGLAGQMVFVDGELQSVGLWDVSNKTQRTANVFVNFCNTEIRGLSEFSMVKCCETLSAEGVRYVNLGGSESESLDAYKRKFDLAKSIDLCSIDAEIKDDHVYSPKRTRNPAQRHRVIVGKSANV